jgi:hypothetical protein
MASWLEIKDYILGKYLSEWDGGDFITIEASFSDGRTQLVFVMHLPQYNPPAVLFQSPIGDQRRINPSALLADEVAQRIPFGIKAVADSFAVTHVAFRDTIDAPEIDVPIFEVAAAADALEERFLGTDEL